MSFVSYSLSPISRPKTVAINPISLSLTPPLQETTKEKVKEVGTCVMCSQRLSDTVRLPGECARYSHEYCVEDTQKRTACPDLDKPYETAFVLINQFSNFKDSQRWSIYTPLRILQKKVGAIVGLAVDQEIHLEINLVYYRDRNRKVELVSKNTKLNEAVEKGLGRCLVDLNSTFEKEIPLEVGIEAILRTQKSV